MMTLADIQRKVGVTPDGVWGPATADAIASALGIRDAGPVLTVRVALELIRHEAIVQEAYLDSARVWTWGIGVTDASGHLVGRYKDNPQPIAHCLAVYIWLLRNNYIPDVLTAFGDFVLTEAQFAAALSFHYNTGAIRTTQWVQLVKAGKMAEARAFLVSHYTNNGDLTERREAEAALFFDGTWSQDGKANVYPVRKPAYTPNWSGRKRIDITVDIAAAIAA